ncbi:Rz1-like lysis system protein LysC [Pseudomonas solani]|uniref:Rz1-like lysis system protein LysC n=1 Tax=Pseudomonas solani TaxID=2731552 RepID=UPI003F4AE4FA
MKTPHSPPGLLSLCLMLLAGCTSAPHSTEPLPTEPGCPAVVACQLPATAPRTNGELRHALDVIEQAWAECAAQVDMLLEHQQAQP